MDDNKSGYTLIWAWKSDKEEVDLRWEEDKGMIIRPSKENWTFLIERAKPHFFLV